MCDRIRMNMDPRLRGYDENQLRREEGHEIDGNDFDGAAA
jgi:hypothetical protein